MDEVEPSDALARRDPVKWPTTALQVTTHRRPPMDYDTFEQTIVSSREGIAVGDSSAEIMSVVCGL